MQTLFTATVSAFEIDGHVLFKSNFGDDLYLSADLNDAMRQIRGAALGELAAIVRAAETPACCATPSEVDEAIEDFLHAETEADHSADDKLWLLQRICAGTQGIAVTRSRN